MYVYNVKENLKFEQIIINYAKLKAFLYAKDHFHSYF